MRFLMKVTLPIETAKAKDGTLGSTIQAILAEQHPEAAYFMADQGERTGILIVNMDDTSQLPALAEPWFLAFNAGVELHPVMVAEDLGKAGPSIEQAVKAYG